LQKELKTLITHIFCDSKKYIMQRIQYIDRLKGLAIILVVMGHIFGFHQPDDGINTFIYTFHMPLFMFLSGLVISVPSIWGRYVRSGEGS
jgi:uncharacterized membrane protein YcfT